jgi:hypothetical protein
MFGGIGRQFVQKKLQMVKVFGPIVMSATSILIRPARQAGAGLNMGHFSMEKSLKRHWGDRRAGQWLRLDGARHFMPAFKPFKRTRSSL